MSSRSFPLPILVGVIGLFIVISIFIILFIRAQKNTPTVSLVGDHVLRNITIQYPNNGYKTSAKNEEAAKEYLRESGIVPKTYVDNAEIIRQVDDNKDQFISKYEVKLSSQHYFFQQYINSIPVQGSLLGIHIRNGDEIYFVAGKVLTNMEVESGNVPIESAALIALNEAISAVGTDVDFENPSVERIIYNGKLLGISNDNRNIPAIKATIRATNPSIHFAKEYYISLVDGEKLDEVTLIYHAINRQIFNCNGSRTSCPLVRSEGSSPVGDSEIDFAYNYFGDTYNLFFNNFQRDSYDNNGATLIGNIRLYSSKAGAWYDKGSTFYTSGMAVNDVIGHEVTHGVTIYTAGLAYKYQSGSMNEGMSDVFGWAVDPNDWSLGEDSILGAMRSLSNPPSGRQPDRLFASNYWCYADDNYGVHINSGILNKTFYLLVNGGNFNTCNISSIGKDRALAIFYRALTRYLTKNSNFKDLYNFLQKSCNDLYGGVTGVCEQVDIAMQATEIDQQPVGVQMGPTCSGQTGQLPKCSSNGPQPTIPQPTQQPSSPTPTGSPTPTVTPGGPTSTPNPTTTATPTPRASTTTPKPTPITLYTCEYDPSCATGQKNIQLCPLICKEKSGGDGRGGAGSPTRIPTTTIPTVGVTSSPTIGATSTPTPTSTPAIPPGNAVDIGRLISSVSESNIRSYMQNLVDDDDISGVDQLQTRFSATGGNYVEAEYIFNTLKGFGLDVEYQQFTFLGKTTRNIIGKIRGRDIGKAYLVTAHMDSTAQMSGSTDPAPGADDNGSGSVAVLEIARVLKTIQDKLDISLEFILFSGEEQGFHGSYYYVGNIPVGKNIRGVLNLDMIGNKASSECVNFMYKNYNGGDIISNKVVEMIGRFNLGLGGVSAASSNGQSDHKPFWDVGIPAIFAHECTFSAVYHSLNDRVESINYSQITKTTKAVVAAIVELANK